MANKSKFRQIHRNRKKHVPEAKSSACAQRRKKSNNNDKINLLDIAMADAITSKRLGYSVDELVDQLSRIYSLKPTKAFQRKVAMALKRGVDYGILVRARNRYRYDPDKALKNLLRGTGVRKRPRRRVNTRTKKVAKKTTQQPPSRASTPEKQRVPRPTVPPPPNFQPPPKNLTREPFNKVIKHSSHSCHR